MVVFRHSREAPLLNSRKLLSVFTQRLQRRIILPHGILVLACEGTLVTVGVAWVIEFFISQARGSNLPHDLAQGTIAAVIIALPTYLLFGTIIRQNVKLSSRFRAAFRTSQRVAKELTLKNQELKLAKARLAELANSDHLTGLTNRRCFEQRLAQNHAAITNGNHIGLLILFDLNGFKLINDEFGHDAGDAVLRHVAVRVRKCIGKRDGFGARVGGDEFAILIREDIDEIEAIGFANNLRMLLRKPHAYKGHVLKASASISLAMRPTEFNSPLDAYISTDEALIMVKRTNKDSITVIDATGENTLAV